MFVHGSLAKHTPRSCCRRPRVLLLYHRHMPRIHPPARSSYKETHGFFFTTRTLPRIHPPARSGDKEILYKDMGIFFTTRTLPRIHAPARSSYKKIVLSTGTIYIYIYVVTMIELQRLVSEYWWAATLDMAPTKPLPGIRLCTGFCEIQWQVYLKQNPCHTDPLKRTLTRRASGACHGKCLKC
jgi:hypothetical protein